ncbi:MAG: hypothetical protein ACTSPI_01355 [Candidatus Heimdallarchaeaceae archaeon]
MKKEIDLSNYIEPESLLGKNDEIIGVKRNYGVIPAFKVKEFIKRLKEDIQSSLNSFGVDEQAEICEIIDERAGEKLK